MRSVNALHAQVGELARRSAEMESERKRLISGRQRLVAEREVLQEQGEGLQEEIADLTERLAALRSGVHGRFVNLSLRTLGLVERQLGVIESLEESEQDPERLETLFKLDHFAARMRRNSENLLVLAGAEQYSNNHPGPVPLLDVMRASISEIERYERVRIQSLPPHSQVAGFAADDLSHLVAELLENATAFSPPDAHVELSGWLLESGEVMLSVQDEGIGMTSERMAELNERLTDAEAASSSETVDEALGLGLYVVVRLAARHGVRVQLRDAKLGGVTAVVVLPGSILPTRPAPSASAASAHQDVAHAPGLPGSVAEANSNALPTRSARGDPAAVAGPPAAALALAPAARPGPGPGHPGARPPPRHPRTRPPRPPPPPIRSSPPRSARSTRPDSACRADRHHRTAARGPHHVLRFRAEPVRPAVARPLCRHHRRRRRARPPEDDAPTATPAASRSADQAPRGPPRRPAPRALRAARPRPTPYAIGPDQHTGPGTGRGTHGHGRDTHGHGRGTRRRVPGRDTGRPTDGRRPARGERRTTSMGLPKRTPKVVAQQQAPTAPRKSGAANAEALRRRLGGFQAGARSGRRDVEAEIAERTAELTIPQTDTDGAGAPGESHVVEEARD
ncbi:ATP-binding protein [Streptomyces lydicus]|nr:ATP-binding protein [Streptomyces lydicus]